MVISSSIILSSNLKTEGEGSVQLRWFLVQKKNKVSVRKAADLSW
jgi:hypothetical protein